MVKANVALVYDADNTLIRGYHPTLILEEYGIDADKFWKEVSSMQKAIEDGGEKTRPDILWLAKFMNEVRHGKLKGLSIDKIKEIGKNKLEFMLYPGVSEFFENIKKENPDYKISHNIASVGIKPMLQSSILGKHMDNIFGYTFLDSFTPGPQIDEVVTTTSSIEKIDAIVKISQGSKPEVFEYAIRNMIYFGDGQTDIPAFRFVRKRHGKAIGIFDNFRFSAYENAKADIGDEVDALVPADYRIGSDLWGVVNEYIQGSRENRIRKKTWPHLFERILSGDKRAEIRIADFYAEEGDILVLEEFNPKKKLYTGRSIEKRIRNINKLDLKEFHTPEEILNNNYYLIDFA